MTLHRTANGKMIDMSALRAKNKDVRAVGNMNVDAAGNTLDSNNRVIADSTRRVNSLYNKTKVNPGAVPRSRTNPHGVESAPQAPTPVQAPQPPIVAQAPVVPEISKEELSVLEDFDAEEPVGKPATKATPKKK